jgi:DHA2 family multidrug resistance protein
MTDMTADGGASPLKARQPVAPTVGQGWRPTHNSWLIAVVVTLAAFMEILDTTIVIVALPHIAGELSSSNDEATWALTAYLVANGIVLTISGWISDTIGRKRYFMICIAMFTVCSLLCGLSQSLGQLIIFRLLQGFFGGGLQPNQQAILLDTFEPSKRAAAFGVTAIATIVAPILGPMLGGIITDSASWRWIFFINIPVGIIAVFLVSILVEDPPWEQEKQKLPRSVDYIGLSLITLGLGSMQILLDRGEDDDWFGSGFIRTMGVLGILGIGGAIAWLLTAKNPIINLNVFKDKSFAMGCVFIGAMGAILFATSVLIPQFAQQVAGYTATLAGFVLSPGAVVVVLLIPIVGQVMKHVQARFIIGFGFGAMGCALLFSSTIVPNADYRTLVLMRGAQTAALAFLYVPISQVAFLTLPQNLRSNGSALYSMFLNVAGSVGISVSTALVTERQQANQAQLSKWMTPFNQPFNTLIQSTETGIRALGKGVAGIHNGAMGYVFQTYLKQATVLGYANVFFDFALVAFCVVPLCFILPAKKVAGGPSAGH